MFIWKYVTICDNIVHERYRDLVLALLQKLATNSFARIDTSSCGTVRKRYEQYNDSTKPICEQLFKEEKNFRSLLATFSSTESVTISGY